uniref:hypothetical protein n=1 Tax=Amycolatopsis sp. CA-290885 TaxID=3239925 RepID=UPI003F492640
MADYYVHDSRYSELVAAIEALPGPWPDGLNIAWISRRIWVFKVDAECPDHVAEMVSAEAEPLETLEQQERRIG